MSTQPVIAFVTGANRGLGLEFVKALQAAGAAKIYAAARDPASITLPGVVPVKLDVTRPEEVTKAAALCSDVTLLINNAGIADFKGFIEEDSISATQRMMDTNFYGMIRVSQAFSPVLKANGGGAILNVLSVASWLGSPLLGPYAATKAAAWSYTNSLRLHLAEQQTQVSALHVGFMDTDMAKEVPYEKVSAASVARQAIAEVAAGKAEILGDDVTRAVKAGLSPEQAVYLTAMER
ncbi:SDR family oxidoreductase [Gallaecimonas pentaromativorans]|uniref:SDR family oxidoreductase n=1 Tax=Gallaecimonas pentaromativorans TaxID=584787 RepID=UPI003A945447